MVCCRSESLAQAAERGGKKVAQIEWAGGREASIQGPTVDYRTFHSGRGVATNYISPTDDAAFVASFGLQFDYPAGFAGQAPFAGAAPTDASGWTNVPQVVQPAQGDAAARARLWHRQVRPERLHLRLAQQQEGGLRPRAVVLQQGRQPGSGPAAQGPVGGCEGQDRRRPAGRQDGRHAGQGRRTQPRTCRRCACSTPR